METNEIIYYEFNEKRGMLSAAHVLAMDAKNLLDVVDSIKQRFEAIFTEYFEQTLVNNIVLFILNVLYFIAKLFRGFLLCIL